MGLRREPLTNGQDRALQVGRYPTRLCVGPGEFEQSIGAECTVAPPPKVKPLARALQEAADSFHRLTGEPEGDRLLAIGKFGVHGCLRMGMTGDCHTEQLYCPWDFPGKN